MDANWERVQGHPAVDLHHADGLPHRLARPGQCHDAGRGRDHGRVLPDFRGTIVVEGAGHWVQQEKPDETNAALLQFLATAGSIAVTYSIVARDAATGQLGVAAQSCYFALGSVLPWARAGVGVVATQSMVDPGYGPRCLDLLADGVGGRRRAGTRTERR